MTVAIEATGPLDAWQQGASLILRKHEIFSLVTSIESPTAIDDSWFARFDPRIVIPSPKTRSLSDVATTIFPHKLYAKSNNRDELYTRFHLVHERARRMHRHRRGWGSYFERLICFGREQINQLELCIQSLNRTTTVRKAAYVMHTSSAETDSVIKLIGNPCLQFIELLCPADNQIDLLVVYRNHDYFYKAFGNFIGLGNLLGFIADETGREAGKLICHSAHAYHEQSASNVRELLRL